MFVKTDDNKKVLILGCDDYKNDYAVRSKVVPYLRHRGVNNLDRLILFSIKNENNTATVKRNFRVKKVLSDTEKDGINEVLGKNTKIYKESYSVEIETGNKSYLFSKLLTSDIIKSKGKVIYPCFYSKEKLLKAAGNNLCIINSLNRKKPLRIEHPNVWDVAFKGMYSLSY